MTFFMNPSRRGFLQTAAAPLASFILPRGLRARENDTSWSLVRDGHHPISPERVIVMTDKGGDGCRDSRLEDSLRASLSEPFDLYSWCGSPMGTYHVPPGKLDLIFRLMRVMTDYYRVPPLFSNWATGLAKREALASTGLGRGFGLLHRLLPRPPCDVSIT